MKKALRGSLIIKALVECPYCDSVTDLFEIQDLMDDGFLYGKLLDGHLGCDDLDVEIDCVHCKKSFKVESVRW